MSQQPPPGPPEGWGPPGGQQPPEGQQGQGWGQQPPPPGQPYGPPTGPQGQGWGPPSPQAPPKEKKQPGPFRIGLLGCLGVMAALVIVGIVIAVLAAGGSDEGTATDEPADSASERQEPATATTVRERKAGVVLLTANGTANGNTKSFSAAGDWDLNWSVKCNGEGYVSINPEGDAFLIGPTTDKTAKGVEHYHEGGRFHLEVIGGPNCSWTVKAVTA